MLTPCELGLYIIALNHAWVNEGLPAGDDDVGRALKVPNFAKLWPRVRECFSLIDGRLRNKRQEQEREDAIRISESRSKAGFLGGKSKANAKQLPEVCQDFASVRAYGSVYESCVSDPKKNTGTCSKDFEVHFSAAWDRHAKHRGNASRQMVAQRLLDVDWDAWDARHVPYCRFWDDAGWTTCSLSMLEWWEQGMPLPPPPAAPKKSRAAQAIEELMDEGEK